MTIEDAIELIQNEFAFASPLLATATGVVAQRYVEDQQQLTEEWLVNLGFTKNEWDTCYSYEIPKPYIEAFCSTDDGQSRYVEEWKWDTWKYSNEWDCPMPWPLTVGDLPRLLERLQDDN